jgi:hypothetical protein
MKSLLLILILVSDQGGNDLAKGVADELARIGGDRARILVADEASRSLQESGVKIADLVATPNIGEHLTDQRRDLIVIYLDRREAAGDIVVDSRLWLDGRSDRHVAIGVKGSEPIEPVVNGIMGLIDHRLPRSGAATSAAPGDEGRLAKLAEAQSWQAILGEIAGIKERSARQYYYEVLAYARLGQRDPAVEALGRMRLAFPGHFLIKAAEELLPERDDQVIESTQEPDEVNEPAPADDGSNTLK